MIVERPALERRVLASLDAGRIPVVLGGCGTGRTSLLLRLQQRLGDDRGAVPRLRRGGDDARTLPGGRHAASVACGRPGAPLPDGARLAARRRSTRC